MAPIYMEILLMFFYMLRLTNCIRDYGTVRLCNSDYKTPGRCFISVNQSLDWHSAEDHCSNYLSRSGHLAAVEDTTSQTLVAEEAAKHGWETAWINGQLKNRFWLWQKHWSYLGYQGCWNDDPDNPDLPIVLPVTDNTKPTDCLKMCEAMGGNDDWYTVGIQKDDTNRKLVCHCNRHWKRKHGPSYNSSCYDPCPGSGIFSGGDIIDKYCGSYRHQLIYFVKGTKFHAFSPLLAPSNNHCVVMNPNKNYQWTEHDCHDPQPFICQYGSSEANCVQRRSYNWANGACITLEMDPLSFYEAQAFCHKYRGNLLRVETADVHEAVKALLDNINVFYIALTNEEWIFSYWDIMFRYYNWGTGQPLEGPEQKCLIINRKNDYKWYNIDCKSPRPFICMVDIKEDKTTTTEKPKTDVPLTTMANNGTVMDRGGFSRGLSIGIGAGAGGTAFIFIFVVLCICCYFRHKEKAAEYKQQSTDQPLSNRHLSLPPQDQELNNQHLVSNGQSTHSQHGVNSSGYLEIENVGYDYEDLNRKSYHEYTDLQEREYDHLEPTPANKKE